jgi:hypothetical protein
MAFEEIKQGNFKETTWVNSQETEPGAVMAEGFYCKPYVGGKFKTKKYIIADIDGTVKGVGTGGGLDKSMLQVNPGDYCRITYKGKQVIEKGEWKGTKAHTFKVEVDRSKAIPEREALNMLMAENFTDVSEDSIPF